MRQSNVDVKYNKVGTQNLLKIGQKTPDSELSSSFLVPAG